MARAASDKKVGESYWRSGSHTDVSPGCFQISCSVRPTPNKRGELPKSLDKYVQVLISMRPNGPGKWSGRLYNADDGQTYAGNLVELGPRTMRVEGCAAGICGGESLTRAGGQR